MEQPDESVAPVTSKWRLAIQQVLRGNALLSLLAVVAALIVSGILIACTDEKVHAAAAYFFARPADTLAASWNAVSGAYLSLFQGAIYNFSAPTFARGIKPLGETLTFATPLIAAGLGVALAFRIGMFNIGGRGQMLAASGAAGWAAFALDLPYGLHLLVAIAAGVVAGALWGGIAGWLKARTGAHEVIVTIMLNYIAFYLLSWMLRTPGLLQAPGSSNPKTPPMRDTAVFPPLFGAQSSLHAGLLLVIAATVFVWWLLNRSSIGFRFRAVGENPRAALVAGIDVKRMYVLGMLFSGGLVGLAGVNQVLGTTTTGFTAGIDAGLGFDAITVALLGRSTPWGTFAAGILFGAFKAGGFTMQASRDIPIEMVTIVQALIVLFIAAPPLIRTLFGLPSPDKEKRRRRHLRKKKLADLASAGTTAAVVEAVK